MRVSNSALEGELTLVRPATPSDVDLLVGWHTDPDVARYWNGETFTPEEMLLRLTRSDVDAYIVESSDGPVGYLQAWFEDIHPDAGGLDMFLIPTARGAGLGPDAAQALARWLLTAGGRRLLTVDPYLSNEVAIRAWKKVGFRSAEEREPDADHDAPWLLMHLDLAGLGLS